MSRLTARLLFLLILPLPSVLQAQDICSNIVRYAARDVSLEVTNASSAYSVFREHCEGSTSRSSDSFSVGIDAVIESIPVGFNLGSGSSEEKLNQFCKVYSESGAADSAEDLRTSTVVREALDAFNQCIALANAGVLFNPVISQTQLNVDVRRGTEDVLLTGVRYQTDVLNCTVRSGDEATAVPADLTTTKMITGGGSIAVSCERLPVNEEDGSRSYPSADLTILTDRGSLLLPIAADAQMPLRWASAITNEINDLNDLHQQAAERVTALEQQDAAFKSLTDGHTSLLARSSATCSAPDFTVVGERTINGQTVFVRALAAIADGAVDDHGPRASGDYVQVYCVLENSSAPVGSLGICLSGEPCPWR